MKKRFVALLCGSILLLSTLVGCQNSGTPTQQTGNTNTPATTTRPDIAIQPISDTELGEVMEKRILQDYCSWRQSHDDETDSVVLKSLSLYNYAGIYNGYVAVTIRRPGMGWGHRFDNAAAGHLFVPPDEAAEYHSLLYANGRFVELDDAYEQKIITEKDVEAIHQRYMESHLIEAYLAAKKHESFDVYRYAKPEDVQIKHHLGCYGYYVAVVMEDSYDTTSTQDKKVIDGHAFVSDRPSLQPLLYHCGVGRFQHLSEYCEENPNSFSLVKGIHHRYMEPQIIADYVKQQQQTNLHLYATATPDGIQIKEYFGQHGDTIVVSIDDAYQTADTAGKDIAIADYTFKTTNPLYMPLAYIDGRFVPLADAYKQSAIAVEQVERIYAQYMIPQVKKDYVAWCRANSQPSDSEYAYYQSMTEADVSLMGCRAIRDNCLAMFIDAGNVLYAESIETEEVAGYTITYSSSQKMTIYKDGQFTGLANAYEQGWITKEDVRKLAGA